LISAYEWAIKNATDDWETKPRSNPVKLARPKAPKPYQSDSTNAIGDSELKALLDTIKRQADGGSLVGKRDYAIVIHLALTGRRRSEVLSLNWGDVKTNGTMVATYHVKGGRIETREVRAPIVKTSLLDYLEASGRLEAISVDDPIWVSHREAYSPAMGRQKSPGGRLTSHAFAKNLKRYAKRAGIGSIHIHQLRHNFARQFADETGSISLVSEALGHSNIATTKVYVERIGLHRDRASIRLAERLELE